MVKFLTHVAQDFSCPSINFVDLSRAVFIIHVGSDRVKVAILFSAELVVIDGRRLAADVAQLLSRQSNVAFFIDVSLGLRVRQVHEITFGPHVRV